MDTGNLVQVYIILYTTHYTYLSLYVLYIVYYVFDNYTCVASILSLRHFFPHNTHRYAARHLAIPTAVYVRAAKIA